MSKINDLIKQYCPDGVEWKELKDICTPLKNKTLKQNELIKNGEYQVINSGRDIYGYYSNYNNEGQSFTIASRGEYAGFIQYQDKRFWAGGLCYPYTSKNNSLISSKFIYYYLKYKEEYIMNILVSRGSIPALNKNDIEKLQIPLPPLPIQQEIVNILDKFTELEAKLEIELEAELEGRKKQYEHYRNTILTFGDDVEWKELGEIGKICMCKRIMKHETNSSSGIPFYKIGTFGKKANAYISNELFQEYKKKYSFPKTGDILISASGTIGKTVVYDGKDAYFQDSNIVWIDNNEKLLYNKFLLYLYSKIDWKTEGGTIKRLYNSNIASVKIPVPPLSVQEKIVTILDKFDKLVNDIKEGLPAEIALRRKQYEFYRNKLLDFKNMEK